MRSAWRKTGFELLLLGVLAGVGSAFAATCQFNQSSGAWNVAANWNNCGAGNGVPAGTPGPADRAEVLAGTVANLPAGVFPVAALYLQGGIVQGVGPGASVINTGGALFTPWGAGPNVLNGVTLNLGPGAGIDSSAGAFNLNSAEFVTNGGTSIIGLLNASGSNAKVKMTGGTAYHATGDQVLLGGAEFENQSGVFKAISSITINGPFKNSGNIEIPAAITLSLANAAAMTQLDPVFSLIFGAGTLSAPGQVLTLATGGVRGPALTFNVGTLNNTGAVVRPSPAFGMVGLLTINGNFTQSGTGLLDFNLGGLAPSQYDRMVVSGSVTLSGGASRGSINGFAPPVGTVLDLITAGSLSGTFSSGSEAVVFNAPRRYIDVYSATKYSVQANETVWVVGDPDDVMPTTPSLRNALTAFNAESGGGCINAPYSIHFFLPMGSTTIAPATPLPVISGCPGLLIDGYQQSGAVPNSSATDWNGTLPVSLDGTGCSACDGLVIHAASTVIKGINFANWAGGVSINALGAGSALKGNYFFQNAIGVYHDAADNMRIGFSGVADRNVFVHSAIAGIASLNAGSTTTFIENNLIGAGAGLASGPNGKGVHLLNTNSAMVVNNIIVNNTKGIAVGSGTGNSFTGNAVYNNTVIGIDLNDDGPTANDDLSPPYDTDMGANLSLNYPKILGVTPTSMTSANLSYELRSNPGSNFQICFCKNPSGGDQCEQPVPMCQPATTDASGLYTNTIGLLGLSAGTNITAYTVATTGPKAGNASEISPAISFVASAPALSITGSGAFPATLVGNTSAVQAITLTNTGTANLTINVIGNTAAATIRDTTGGPAPSMFHYCGFGSSAGGVPLTAAPIIIPPMASCTINLAFTPAAAGAVSGTLTITSDAAGSPHTVALSGTGTAAATSSLSPAGGLNFGTLTAGVTSSPLQVTFTNTSGSILSLSAVSFVGGGAGFNILASSQCLMTPMIAPAGTCTLDYTATPPSSGTFTDNTYVTTSPPSTTSPAQLSLTVMGAAAPVPSMTVSFAPSSVTTGGNSILTVTLTNPAASLAGIGAGSVTLPAGLAGTAPMSNSCGTFGSFGGQTYSFGMGSIPAMGSCTIDITVSAAAAGMYTVNIMPGQLSAGAMNTNSSSATLTVTAAIGPYGYITNLTGNSVSVIALSTNTVAATIPVGTNPAGVGVNAVGTRAYVANGGSNTVSVIDTASNTVVATVPVGTTPFAAAVNPAGTKVYVANFGTNNVSVIDTSTNTVTATIPGGNAPSSVAVHPAGTRAYVSNQNSQDVTVINTATNAVIATVPIGGVASGIAVAPNGSRVYVVSPGASNNTIFTIDTSTNTVVNSYSSGSSTNNDTQFLGVDIPGSRIYAANQNSGSVTVVDANSGSLLATIPVGAAPHGVAFNAAGTRAYVANRNSNNVSVIDTTTNTVVATIPVGAEPFATGVFIPRTYGPLTPPLITSPAPAAATASVAYSHTFSASGTAPFDWSVATGTLPAGMTLNAQTGVLTGTPAAAGTFTFTVQAFSGVAPNGTQMVTLVVAPPPASAITLTPPGPLAFGSRTVNTTSPPQAVALTNSGAGSLVISSITSSGDFGFTTTCPILTPPIAPTAPACNINITFTPLTAAALTGTITIVSNAPGSPHTISLTGTGVPVPVPAISLSGSVLNLGAVLVSTVSAPSSLVVTNTGLATLNFTAIAVTGAGFARTTPAAVSPPDCAASLAPTASCQVAVTCAPLSTASLTGQLSLTHNATGSPSLVTLACTGTPAVPLLTLTPSVDFGDQVLGITSTARPAFIVNSGTSALAVSALTLGGTHAAQFTATGTCTSVAPGASCPVNVTFTPATTGAKTAVLNVASNAINGATVNAIALTGNGVLAPRPIANVSVTAIGFGNTIFAGATSTQLVTLRNDGGQAMAISAVVATGDYVVMNTCPATLAPQASCAVNVAFSPLAIGSRSGSLQVFSNATGSPHTVLLSGTGCRWFSQATSRFFLAACG